MPKFSVFEAEQLQFSQSYSFRLFCHICKSKKIIAEKNWELYSSVETSEVKEMAQEM